MRWIRRAAATVAFIVGFLALGGGFLVAGLSLLLAGGGHPLDVGAAVGGAASVVFGFACLWASRAVGGDDGPIKDYRDRPRRRRSPTA